MPLIVRKKIYNYFPKEGAKIICFDMCVNQSHIRLKVSSKEKVFSSCLYALESLLQVTMHICKVCIVIIHTHFRSVRQRKSQNLQGGEFHTF